MNFFSSTCVGEDGASGLGHCGCTSSTGYAGGYASRHFESAWSSYDFCFGFLSVTGRGGNSQRVPGSWARGAVLCVARQRSRQQARCNCGCRRLRASNRTGTAERASVVDSGSCGTGGLSNSVWSDNAN